MLFPPYDSMVMNSMLLNKKFVMVHGSRFTQKHVENKIRNCREKRKIKGGMKKRRAKKEFCNVNETSAGSAGYIVPC